MKKLLTVLLVLTSFALADTGWYSDYVIINVNGAGTETPTGWYWIGGNPSYATELNGYNFGAVSSLVITGCDMKYWSDTQDRTGGAFYYKIMNQDGSVDIKATVETIWTQSYLGGNDYQGLLSDLTINVLTGLEDATTYQLHIWAKSWGTGQGDSWLNNGGANYVATFTVPIVNHATSFSATTGGCYEIDLSWTDAAGPGLPEAYLIKASTTNYESIGTPVDGTPESDAALVKNVTYGTQSVTFSGLSANTAYYFKIWPYYGSGASIDYKTDSTVPTATVSTLSVPPTPTGFSAAASGYDDIRLSWDAYTYTDYDIMIVYNTDGGDPATPADGVAYENGYSEHFSGTVVNLSGTETGYLHESLSEGTYYYYAWLKNAYDNYSSYATTNAEPALLISLSSFSAAALNGCVSVTWVTESESENAHFLLYRDGEVIAQIPGAGTTSEPHSYAYTDRYVVPGRTYTYQLADVSFDGEETTHNEVKIKVEAEYVDRDYNIGPAYPNPFNPTTVVPLNLAKEAVVTATLCDVSGRPLRELLNGTLSAGPHAITIDGANLSTGVYFVRINVNDAVNVQKIALMK